MRGSHQRGTKRATHHRPTRDLVASAVLAAAAILTVACENRDAQGPSTHVDAKDPADADAQVAFAREPFDDAARAIETYIAANRTREAELVARKLVEQAGSDAMLGARAQEYAARAYFARAELADDLTPLQRESLVREAAQAAQRAVATGSNTTPTTRIVNATSPSLEARRFAAMLADRVGDHAIAQTLYDAALAAAPDDLATLLPAALSALSHDARDPRIDEFAARHERLAPDAPWSAALRAEIALARGDASIALTAAETALARDREMLEMRLDLAKALRANNRARDAARLLSALSEIERSKPAIAQQFALALTESGESTRAAAAWDLAIRATPNDPYLRAEAALAFLRDGDEARAASELAALEALFGGAAQRARIEPAIRSLRARAGSPAETPAETPAKTSAETAADRAKPDTPSSSHPSE